MFLGDSHVPSGVFGGGKKKKKKIADATFLGLHIVLGPTGGNWEKDSIGGEKKSKKPNW